MLPSPDIHWKILLSAHVGCELTAEDSEILGRTRREADYFVSMAFQEAQSLLSLEEDVGVACIACRWRTTSRPSTESLGAFAVYPRS